MERMRMREDEDEDEDERMRDERRRDWATLNGGGVTQCVSKPYSRQ